MNLDIDNQTEHKELIKQTLKELHKSLDDCFEKLLSVPHSSGQGLPDLQENVLGQSVQSEPPPPLLAATVAYSSESSDRESKERELVSSQQLMAPSEPGYSDGSHHILTRSKFEADDLNRAPSTISDSVSMAPSHSGNSFGDGIFDNRQSRLEKEITAEMKKVTLNKLWRVEVFTAAIIVSDASFLGWAVNNAASEGAYRSIIDVGNLFFCLVFVLELAIRLKLRKLGFFRPPNNIWNMFDLVIVCTCIVEECIRLTSNTTDPSLLGQISILRLLRVCRLWRVLRVLRTWDSFRELRMLLRSSYRVIRCLVCAALIAFTLFYSFGLSLTAGIARSCIDMRSDGGMPVVCVHFGSLGHSMASLYKAASGGMPWGDLVDALSQVDAIYTIVFVVCVSISKFVVANMVVAVVIVIMQQTSRRDLEDLINDEVQDQRVYIDYLTEIFDKIDTNNSNTLTPEELVDAMDDERIEGFFRSLKIHTQNPRELFQLLDRKGKTYLKMDEFVEGCLWLKGEARTVDLLNLAAREANRNGMRRHSTRTERRIAWESSLKESTDTLHRTRSEQDTFERLRSEQLAKVSRRRSVVQRTKINKVEERAIGVDEFHIIRTVLKNQCQGENWKDLTTLGMLTPETVNLYHFNYYVIAPLTAPSGVRLKGLDYSIEVGSRLEQLDMDNSSLSPVAVGQVKSNTEGDITIDLELGAFKLGMPVYVCKGADKPIPCGTPSAVCCRHACSYKEVIAGKPMKPQWFCSHWWGESILDFLKCCEEHGRLRQLKKETFSYWICAYANCQHKLDFEIGAELKSSSFFKALHIAKGTLLHLEPDAQAFDRIWCDYELFQTIAQEKPLDIVTMAARPELLADQLCLLPNEPMLEKTLREQGFPIGLIAKGLRTELQDGKATQEQDKSRILDGMKRENVDVFFANSRLHGFLARAMWPQAMKHGSVEDYQLPSILAKDQGRKKLQMDLASFDDYPVQDADLRLISNGLPKQLETVKLRFRGCTEITNLGVLELAESVSRLSKLKVLILDFSDIPAINDDALVALAQQLPESLQEMQLHFNHCTEISRASTAALAANLPSSLRLFSGTFQGTRVGCNFTSKAEFLKHAKEGSGRLLIKLPSLQRQA